MFCNLLNYINLLQMKYAIWQGLGTRLAFSGTNYSETLAL